MEVGGADVGLEEGEEGGLGGRDARYGRVVGEGGVDVGQELGRCAWGFRSGSLGGAGGAGQRGWGEEEGQGAARRGVVAGGDRRDRQVCEGAQGLPAEARGVEGWVRCMCGGGVGEDVQSGLGRGGGVRWLILWLWFWFWVGTGGEDVRWVGY